MSRPEEFVVITGGPGAGKSALLGELDDRGYPTSPEAGREILRDQARIGGRATHTGDQLVYAEIMLAWGMRAHRRADCHIGPVFFDRGVPDLIGYYRLIGHPVPAHVRTAAENFRYHPRVFVAPPWPAIYATDTERGQDFAEAVRTHDTVAAAYAELGYELVALPEADIAARADFVLSQLGDLGYLGGIG